MLITMLKDYLHLKAGITYDLPEAEAYGVIDKFKAYNAEGDEIRVPTNPQTYEDKGEAL